MRRLRSLLFFSSVLALLLLFLSQTASATQGVRWGLDLFFKRVFPALFPFLVLSEFILSLGVEQRNTKYLTRPLSLLFGISEAGAGALFLGILCGQPIASSSAVALLEKGTITEREARRISLFANNPGSGFLVASVGGTLFGSTEVGIALFCITWLSAALLGILLHLLLGNVRSAPKKCQNGMDKLPFPTLFTQAVQRGFSAAFHIGAFLVFFSALSFSLTALLKHTALDTRWYAGIMGGLEITSGIHHAVKTLTPDSALRLTSFLCSFGGVCVCMQILSVTQKCAVPVWHYLLAKLMQGGIALLLCEGYLRFFKPVLSPVQSIPTGRIEARFPVLAFLLVLLFALLLSKRKEEKISR